MDEEHREQPRPERVHGEPLHLDDTPLAGGAPQSPDVRWWGDVEGRHQNVILIGVVAAVVVVAIGIGVAVAIVGTRVSSGPASGPVNVAIPETTASVVATIPLPSGAASTSTEPTQASSPAARRAPFVSYRKDGAVWVVRETGAQPKRLFNSAQGPYALSPDGLTLAVVDAASQTLSLVDVETGRQATVGTAVPERPCWSPDSSVVLYTAQVEGGHDTEVVRVSRDGSSRTTLGPGSSARFAPDGSVVAVSTSSSATGTPIVVFSQGGFHELGRGVSVNAVSPLVARIVFADQGGLPIQGSSRPPSLRTISYSGAGEKTLVAKPKAGTGVFFGDVVAAPDGSWVAYTETGDDGYSRLYSIRPTGGAPIALWVRRDDYIVGWSADVSEIFFIEGNAVQGESTRLMAVHPDGTARRIVVDGAGQ
jgi:hypothetical protein